jgi:hypothetical protein
MAIITEKKPIVGKLVSQGCSYNLLALKPSVPGVSALLREYGLQFYVVVEGFAQHVVVSKASFLIVPYPEPEIEDVKYVIEESDTESNIPIIPIIV